MKPDNAYLLGVVASADPDVSRDGKVYYRVTVPVVVEMPAEGHGTLQCLYAASDLACEAVEKGGLRVMPDANINVTIIPLSRRRNRA